MLPLDARVAAMMHLLERLVKFVQVFVLERSAQGGGESDLSCLDRTMFVTKAVVIIFAKSLYLTYLLPYQYPILVTTIATVPEPLTGSS